MHKHAHYWQTYSQECFLAKDGKARPNKSYNFEETLRRWLSWVSVALSLVNKRSSALQEAKTDHDVTRAMPPKFSFLQTHCSTLLAELLSPSSGALWAW